MKKRQNVVHIETLEILYQADKCGSCAHAKECPNNINKQLDKPSSLDWRLQGAHVASMTQSTFNRSSECL